MRSRASFALKVCTLSLFAVALLAPAALAQRAVGDAIGDMVKIDSGMIQGSTAGSLHVYRGIPYAAPPIGELRWKPTQPVVAWTGVRPATNFGPRSMQGGGGGARGAASPTPAAGAGAQSNQAPATPPARLGASTPMKEDCLYLNVVTPAKTTGEKLDVLVNIHGGNFTGGSGQMDMSRLAESENIVCVGINYRLGALGFMAHPALSKESPQAVSGNYGLLDQIAALKWVQKNIAAFGGDPAKVTITGCSAGGESILYMMSSPLSKGLFRHAIPCSGPYPNRTPALAAHEQTGKKVIEGLGVADGPDVLKAMRELPADKILVAGGRGMFPTVDKWVLTDTSLNVFREGKQHNVPMMIGSASSDIAGATNQIGDRNLAAAMKTVPSKAYIYVFTHGAASHCLDQRYILGAMLSAPNASEADKTVSKNMMRIWGKFIKTGDPSIEGLVKWPAYEESADEYLDIGEKLEVKKGVLAATRPRAGGGRGAARGTNDQEEECDECEEIVDTGPEGRTP